MNSTLRVVAIAVFGVILTGCQSKVSSSNLTATVAGRLISATIDGPASIHPQEDGATVSTESNKIVVKQDRVLLDGMEIGKFPTAAKNVVVNVANGQLLVIADGAQVVSMSVGQ